MCFMQANILVDADWKVRLADFGLAVFAESMSNANSSKREGSVRWLAPEIIDPERFGKTSSRPTYESDVYSFGVVCVEVGSAIPRAPLFIFIFSQLYLGRAPLENLLDVTLLRDIPEGLRPNRPHFAIGSMPMSDELWQLTNLSWENLASDRPKAEELVQHMAKVLSSDARAGACDETGERSTEV